jgi:hypothetical protein
MPFDPLFDFLLRRAGAAFPVRRSLCKLARAGGPDLPGRGEGPASLRHGLVVA